MDILHQKVKYLWFISLPTALEKEQKELWALMPVLPRLVKISKKGLLFDRPFSPSFLYYLFWNPDFIYLRVSFKLSGHFNWRHFDIKKMAPLGVDVNMLKDISFREWGNTFSKVKELFFVIEEEKNQDFSTALDYSKF